MVPDGVCEEVKWGKKTKTESKGISLIQIQARHLWEAETKAWAEWFLWDISKLPKLKEDFFKINLLFIYPLASPDLSFLWAEEEAGSYKW